MLKYKIKDCESLIGDGFSLVVADKNKKPLWSNWQNTSKTFSSFRNYYKKDNAEITGIVCDGNIECIDVDLKILPDSKRPAKMKELIKFFSDNIDDFALKFFVQKTPSNGFHIIYKTAVAEGNKKIAFVETSTDKFECLIETRGTGGYFGIYKDLEIIGSARRIKTISDDDRNILLHCCESLNEKIDIPSVPKSIVKELKTKENQIMSWQDYDAKTDVFDVVSGHFRMAGKTPKGLQIKRIGGNKGTSHSGYIYTDRNIMYLFSANSIFPAEQGLSPSACLAYRDFNGDFGDCAKWLYSQGFGERVEKKESKKIKLETSPETPSSGQFPIHVFPDWLKNYIIEIHNCTGFPIDFLCASFIFTFSVVCGCTYGLPKRTGSLEFPIIWMCLVAKAGNFKSPAMSEMIKPLRVLNSQMHSDYNQELLNFKRAQENAKKGQQVTDAPPRKQIAVVDDVTFEALIDIHQNNRQGMGYVKDELAGMISQFSKYSGAGSDVSQWLSLFNGDSVTLERKQAKSAFLDQSFVSLIGGVQPEVIHTIITSANKGNGFVDRMLFVSNSDPVPPLTKKKVLPHHKNEYIKKMSAAYAQTRAISPNQSLILTQKADDKLIEIINELRSFQNDNNKASTAGMNAKLQTYLHRFTVLCHLMTELLEGSLNSLSVDVTEQSVINAHELVKFFASTGEYVREKQAIDSGKMRFYESLNSQGLFNRAEQAVALFKKFNGQITFQEIAEMVGYSGKAAAYNAIKNDDECQVMMNEQKNAK